PLRVADHHVVGVAARREFAEGLGLEIRPWRGFNLDCYTALFFVVLDQFLQVIRRIPLCPQDRQRLRGIRRASGERENSAGQQAGPFLLAHLILLTSYVRHFLCIWPECCSRPSAPRTCRGLAAASRYAF